LKILIGIGHPADVHFFRHFISTMKARGHEVFVAAREKEITCLLLDTYTIPYYRISFHRTTILSKLIEYFIRWVRTYRLCKRLRPDIALGFGDFYLAQVGRVCSFATIVITDTERAVHDSLLTFPFASHVVTPMCYKRAVGKKQIRYNSYKELAYLGKPYFTPDPAIYSLLGITNDQKFVIIRFVARTAVHDIGHRGMTPQMKRMVVKEFATYARVFISSEQELPEDLKEYKIPCSPEKIHDAVYYADLLYGESATMASEAACLGTPAIYVDDHGRGYTDEQEHTYGLVFNFTESIDNQKRSIQKGIELLTTPNDKQAWQKKREKLLSDKIDPTAFMVRLIENYPQSLENTGNPEYQYGFRGRFEA
jgi:uncharacterized protein